MEVFGHRGAAGLVAENTLAGFRRAAELGCHGVECDVRAVEGRLVLLHDATVDRTTNGRGSLSELGATGVRRLDAGGGPVPWVAEVVPLLGEYPELRWNLELKDTASVPLLREEMKGWPAGVRARILVSSFHSQALSPLTGTGVDLALCADRIGPVQLADALRLGCGAVHLALEGFVPDAVAAARDVGLVVRVFTVNDPAVARGLDRQGVQGVFTDRPDLILATRGPWSN